MDERAVARSGTVGVVVLLLFVVLVELLTLL